MTDTHSSQTEKRAGEKADCAEDMAALLFAELFHEQCMAEREQKRRQAHGEQFDSRPTKGLQ